MIRRVYFRSFAALVVVATTGVTAFAQDYAGACASGDCGSSMYGGSVIDGGIVDGGVVDGGAGSGTFVSDDGYVGDLTAGGARRGFDHSDLFYNYYTQGYANRANAQMYLSPLPVPPNVGHTFYTYQPFNPHHYLYPHKDRYHNYYDGGRGLNRTKVSYYHPPVKVPLQNLYWNFLRIPR